VWRLEVYHGVGVSLASYLKREDLRRGSMAEELEGLQYDTTTV
jgi:hypothetical protein